MIFHPLSSVIRPPKQFNNPFDYDPHPLCLQAVTELQQHLDFCKEGKMFGVLIVEYQGKIGYLQAYSGQIEGRYDWPDFVPPVFDYTEPNGWFRREEARIVQMNESIRELESSESYKILLHNYHQLEIEATEAINRKAEDVKNAKQKRDTRRQEGTIDDAEQAQMIRESQFLKAELHRTKRAYTERMNAERTQINDYEKTITDLKQQRRQASDALQQWLFSQFSMLNAHGERCDLLQIFADYDRENKSDPSSVRLIPPSGAGECCEPKLLQYAFEYGMRPLSMAMFWWGKSPKDEIRHQGYYYPACNSKCKPILKWMLRGLDVMPNQLEKKTSQQLEIIYDDPEFVVVNKPAGMLSVPGKSTRESVYSILRARYPLSDGPMIVHRLDMATSGLLVVAKTKYSYIDLQRQFKEHQVKKKYLCITDNIPTAVTNHDSIVEGGVVCNDQQFISKDLKTQGTISLPLAPDLEDRPRQRVDYQYGKPATSEYEILSCEAGRLRVVFSPLTGRTHQLRVHCAHSEGLNHAILGDALYGRRADRLYLQAIELSFRHPCSGEVMTFTADPEF